MGQYWDSELRGGDIDGTELRGGGINGTVS